LNSSRGDCRRRRSKHLRQAARCGGSAARQPDRALISLVNEGAISEERALKNADSANNVRLQLKLHRDGGVAGDVAKGSESAWGGLSLEALEEPEETGES